MKTNFKQFLMAIFAVLLGVGSLSAKNGAETKTQQTTKATEINNAAFRSLIFDYKENAEVWKFKGQRPAIIDFYASWCGPCKRMAPIMDTMAQEFQGKVDVYKVNIDKERELAALFQIRSIPTFLFIPKSGKPQLVNGAMTMEEMRKLINDTLLP